MRFKRPFILCNTAAGRGSAGGLGSALAALQSAGEGGFPVHETAPDERIDETVRAAVEGGCDLVVAAGGDGTVSAAMAGAAGTGVPLAIVPAGTTNLIARELGIPLDPGAAARLAASASTSRSVDAMAVAGRCYFLQVGVGITALAVDGTTRELKSRFGVLAYPGAAARRLAGLRPSHLDITVDGERYRVRSIEATVANNGVLAGMFFRKGPDVRMDDGHIDVCVLAARTPFDYPRLVCDMLTGRRGSPRVLFLPAGRCVRIESRTPLAVQADGDIIGTTPVEIEVRPRAVSVIAPEAAERTADRSIARSLLLDPYIEGLRRQWST